MIWYSNIHIPYIKWRKEKISTSRKKYEEGENYERPRSEEGSRLNAQNRDVAQGGVVVALNVAISSVYLYKLFQAEGIEEIKNTKQEIFKSEEHRMIVLNIVFWIPIAWSWVTPKRQQPYG